MTHQIHGCKWSIGYGDEMILVNLSITRDKRSYTLCALQHAWQVVIMGTQGQ